MPDIRTVTPPPELNELQAQLAMQSVLDEMGNPQGLRLDEPVTDPLTQYKHDLRVELSGFPQTIETQLAGEAIMVEAYIVPEAETAEPVPPPDPTPPELTQLSPNEWAAGVADLGVQCIGGPFVEGDARIIWGGVEQVTQFISDTRLSCVAPAAVEAGSVDVLVRQGEDETAAQTFTWTEAVAPPPPPDIPEGASGTPIVEGA